MSCCECNNGTTTKTIWDIDFDDAQTIVVLIIYISIILVCLGVCWKLYKIFKLADSSQYRFQQVLTYRMDYWLSTSIWSKAVGLMVFVIVIMMFGGVLHLILANSSITYSLWYSWTRMADPGTHAGDTDFGERIVGVFCTLAGLVALGFLIGIVSDLINQRVDNLRKGKSVVTEEDHLIILSEKWSFAIIPVIQELCNANYSEGGAVIVLLSDGEKEGIENQIASSNIKWQNSRFVVRTGSIVNLVDLKKVSVHLAKSIIVMTDKSSEPDDADAQNLRVVLSLLHMQTKGNIVVEIRNIRNKKLFTLLGKKKIEPVVAHDMIGRIMIQCSRQPGLAQAIDEMLGFDGSEIYSKFWKECIGKTFRECLFCFEKATIIGIKLADPRIKNIHKETNMLDKFIHDSEAVMTNIAHEVEHIMNPLHWFGHNEEVKTKISPDLDFEEEGTLSQAHLSISDDPNLPEELHRSLLMQNRGLWLNPNDDYVLKDDDELILLAPDVDEYWYHPRKNIPPPENYLLNEQENKPEKFLFVGWRHDLRVMLSTLDQYVPKKSTVEILADIPISDREELLNDLKVKNLQISHHLGNTVCQKTLEEFPLETYDTILCLADYAATNNTRKLEARVMATYALLRHILVTRTLNKEALGKMFGHEGKVMTLTETYRNIHLVRKRADLNWFKLQRIRDNIDLPQSLEELNILAKTYHLPLIDIKGVLNRKKTDKINDVDVLVNSLEKRILAFKEDKTGQLISEIMDPQAKDLVLVNDHTQYVASDELSSKALAMVSEWPDVNVLLAELLSPVGNELYCRSAMQYINAGENISFDELTSRVRCYNEIAIGYIDDGPEVVVPEVKINPDDKDKKRIWNNRDRVIVLGCLVEGNEEDHELYGHNF